jgi:hypothetical protein
MSSDDLNAIVNIINTNVTSIQQLYAKHRTPIPSLSEPYKPLTFEPELTDATNLVVAAATQLIAILRPPAMNLVAAVGGVGCIYLIAIVMLTVGCSNTSRPQSAPLKPRTFQRS